MKKTNFPYVICHMMQTLDGKIASGVEGVEIIMDYFDLYAQTEQQLEGNVWMFGRKTAAAFAEPMSELSNIPADVENSENVVTNASATYAVVVDTKGLLRWSNNYINLTGHSEEFRIITLVTKRTPKAYLAYLSALNISYLTCGDEELNLMQAMTRLKEIFGIDKVLLEGGGSLNGSMMAQGLVDEISLLLLPRVLNKKDAPTLFDAESSSVSTTQYSLVSTQPLERDVLWLRYSRK